MPQIPLERMVAIGNELIRLTPQLVQAGLRIYHWCPACSCAHSYNIDPTENPNWKYNGDRARPTFTPSMLVFVPVKDAEARKIICHYFLTDGIIHYCGDSPHHLRNLKIPLPVFPMGYRVGGEVT